MLVLTRPSKAADLSLVFDSWLNSWRTSKYAGCIPNHLYFTTQRTLIEDLIARGAKIEIAHPEGYPDLIMGWLCTEMKDGETVVHYAWVKLAYEKDGVVATLLQGRPRGFITHKQDHRELRGWPHRPEAARRKTL